MYLFHPLGLSVFCLPRVNNNNNDSYTNNIAGYIQCPVHQINIMHGRDSSPAMIVTCIVLADRYLAILQ